MTGRERMRIAMSGGTPDRVPCMPQICHTHGVNLFTVQDVRAEALKRCRDGGADGGYILASGDMVPDFSPKENVTALVDTAKAFTYPERKKCIGS